MRSNCRTAKIRGLMQKVGGNVKDTYKNCKFVVWKKLWMQKSHCRSINKL